MARMARMGELSQRETGLEVPGLAQEFRHPMPGVWFSDGFSYGEREAERCAADDARYETETQSAHPLQQKLGEAFIATAPACARASKPQRAMPRR